MDQEMVWIQKIASGDRTAFEELFHAYKRRLFGYAFRIMGDASDAEELTSDVLVEVWKGAARFGGRSRVSTWIFGIAHHKVVDELRRRRPRELDIDSQQDLVHPDESPERAALRKDEHANLRAKLTGLSPEHREVIELAFFQGYSVEEIAAIVQCPPATVKTRMFYARKKLREILDGNREGERS
jgi:RNA polymerase sigma-70 factor (ECF subfamily)